MENYYFPIPIKPGYFYSGAPEPLYRGRKSVILLSIVGLGPRR